MIRALTLLLLCQLAGEAAVRAAGAAVPGPVLGMLLLLVLLALRKGPSEEMRQTSGVILTNLSLMFVPAGVGIMQHVARIREEWVAIGVALLVSTLLAMAAAAIAFRVTARLMRQDGETAP